MLFSTGQTLGTEERHMIQNGGQLLTFLPTWQMILFGFPGKVTMRYLYKLSSASRDIRIIDESSVKYRDIGTILLNDNTGAIISSISESALRDPFIATRMIYQRWMSEQEDHSWKNLTQCFRDVKLNALAGEIEKHFNLPSPPRDPGIVVHSFSIVKGQITFANCPT